MATVAPCVVDDDGPPILTICGDAGTGKTSLAATFPAPVFIRAEDGLKSIPKANRPASFPLLKSADELWEQLLWLLQNNHDYKTLVIDSVSALEALFTKDILDRDGRAKTLNQALGGYGAGYSALAAMHQRVRKAAGLLNDRKGMAVIFISHADLETMRLPDSDDYSRYSLRMNSKSLPPYVDDVDLVGFVRLVSALRGEEGDRKKIISNGDRELICYATAASVSKNRFGITEPLECEPGVNPLAEILGLVEAPKPAEKRKSKPKAEAETEAAKGRSNDASTQEASTPEAEDVDPADFAETE